MYRRTLTAYFIVCLKMYQERPTFVFNIQWWSTTKYLFSINFAFNLMSRTKELFFSFISGTKVGGLGQKVVKKKLF